ncbi:hypothetical protein PJI74_01270 [Mycobacterium kansasii]
MAINLSGSPEDIGELLRRMQQTGANAQDMHRSYVNDARERGRAEGKAEAAAEPKKAEAPKSEPKPEPKTDDTAAPKPDPKTADATEPKPDTKADTPEPKPDAKPGRGAAALDKMGLPAESLRQLKSEPLAGVKGIGVAQWNAGQHHSGKMGAKLAEKFGAKGIGKTGIKAAARALPVVGSLYAGYSAWKSFEKGDYVGAALNILGVIPGPVGWVGLGLATAWDLAGWGNKIGEWAEPDGETVWMLQAAAKDMAGVTATDSLIRQAQLDVFRFQDGPTGTVWDSSPPAAIRLDTAEVKAAAEAYFNGISDLFQQIDKAMTQAGEQYFSEQRQQLAPHLAAMAALKQQVQPLMAQLGAASDGAKVAYDGVLHANRSARQQISDGGTLSDSGPATTMRTQIETGSSQIAAANDKLGQLFAETPPPVVMARGTTAPTGTRPAETKPQEVKPVAPVATAPAATTPSPAATTPKTETPKQDDLSKLLNQLGQQAKANTPTQNPLSSTGSGVGGGSPLGSQGLGGGQGGGTPLAQSKPDTSTKEEPKKLVDSSSRPERKTAEKKLDDKSLSTPKAQNAKAAVPAEAKSAPAAAPVATPAPAAVGPTPAQQNAAHAAAAQEPSKEVDVKGTKTTFPDAKTAKMAELLSKADPTHPVSLADAAKQAGLTPPTPGQDPGKQVAPTDAKPGDILVAGGKNFMLLGDGKFYDLTDYKVVGASEIPQSMGDRAGYFHLSDPNPGQPAGQGVPAPQTAPAAPQGPVSGQTGGTPFQVPGATGAPTGPTDTSPPPAAPGGVPAAGTPGVPKPGAPGSGPANAASTDTGVGVGGPSTGGQKLDPAAVR